MDNNGPFGIPGGGSRSHVYVTGQVALGSASGNQCLTFPVVAEYTGSDIQYVNDTVNGDMMIINKAGVYGIVVCPCGGAAVAGVTVNSKDLTASPNGGLTYAQGMRGCLTESGAFSTILPLLAGDIVRCQVDTGTLGGGAVVSQFNITRIS